MESLSDVLQMLPLDVVAANIWTTLKNDKGGGSLKLASRQSSLLADSLIQAVSFDLTVPHASSFKPRLPGAPDSDTDDEDAQDSSSSDSASGMGRATADGREEADWQQALQHRTAFVARLPSLSALTLRRWPNEAHLSTELMACGRAGQDRLQRLVLRGDLPLSAACMRAARLACPALADLELEDTCPASDYPEDGVQFGPRAPRMDLQGALFLPLHGAHLTKLVVLNCPDASRAVLRSVGGLTHLRHLHLHVCAFASADLRPLAALRSLRHCDVGIVGTRRSRPCLTFLQAAPLLASTHLTTLRLRCVTSVWRRTDSDGSETAAALALLGALVGLRSLDLGDTCELGDAEFAALRRLTQLTALRFGGLRPSSPPAPGHLPLLQLLHSAAQPRPSSLLKLLLPLLPLPSLTDLNTGRDGCSPAGSRLRVHLSVKYYGAEGAAREVAALGRVAECLAAAPRLPPQLHLHLVGHGRPLADGHLGAAQVVDALQPLGGRVTQLTLDSMPVSGVDWERVQQVLPCLHDLCLHVCALFSSHVATIVEHVTSLRRLALSMSDFVEIEGEGWVDVKEGEEVLELWSGPRAGWVRLAGLCSRPLLLLVRDEPLPPAVVAACRAEQLRCFGRQHIRWSEDEEEEAATGGAAGG